MRRPPTCDNTPEKSSPAFNEHDAQQANGIGMNNFARKIIRFGIVALWTSALVWCLNAPLIISTAAAQKQLKAQVSTEVQEQAEAPAAAAGQTAEDRQAALLRRLTNRLAEKGIEPTTDGLRKYLIGIHPSAETTSRAAKLIEELGAKDFAVRERATQELFRIPSLPVDILRDASRSSDPEVAWRADALLEFGRIEFGNTLYLALEFIETAQLKGLTKEVFGAFPLCTRSNEVRKAREALLATFEPTSRLDLHKALDSSDLVVRRAAAHVLAQAEPSENREELLKLLDNDDELTRLEAAEGLANLGERTVLASLVNLLSASEVSVRVRASVILRQMTGETFKYAAYDREEKRTESVKQWQQWLAEKSPTAELTYPLSLAKSLRSYLNGNTLLALGYSNKVIEIDPNGEVVYSVDAAGAWMAERLANGNTLVAAYSSNKLIEYGPEQQPVWEMDIQSILSARPLENGNFLVTQHSQKKVLEVSREKETVWSWDCAESCCDAIRLENGNTLVAHGKSIDEVTPDGEVVWEYDGNQVYGINLVDNGNLLVAQLNGQVLEIDRGTKEAVWEYACSNPVDAVRLPNGNTLITSNNQFLEVTPDKEVVWKRDGCNYGTARR